MSPERASWCRYSASGSVAPLGASGLRVQVTCKRKTSVFRSVAVSFRPVWQNWSIQRAGNDIDSRDTAYFASFPTGQDLPLEELAQFDVPELRQQ
jgi:hypothetical protein